MASPSVDFTFSAGSQRLTVSTGVPTLSAGSFIQRMRIITYSDWGNPWSVYSDSTHFVGTETASGGRLYMNSQFTGGYGETNIWTDGYTGTFTLANTLDGSNNIATYKRQGQATAASVTRSLDGTLFTPTTLALAGVGAFASDRNGRFQYDFSATFNVILTNEEIAAWLNAGRSNYPITTRGLVMWFPMPNALRCYFDMGGRGNHGVVTGSPITVSGDLIRYSNTRAFNQKIVSAAASGVLVLAGTGTITATGTGAATANGVLTGAGTVTETGTGAATASGVLTGAGTVTETGTGAATGTGKLLADGTVSASGTGAATGTGALAAAGTVSASGTGAATGTGALAAAGTAGATGSGAATGTGALVAAGSMGATGTGAGTGTGALVATGTITVTGTGDVTLAGQSDLLGSGTVSVSGGTATLDAPGVLRAAGTVSVSGTGAVTGTGVLTGAGTIRATGTGRLNEEEEEDEMPIRYASDMLAQFDAMLGLVDANPRPHKLKPSRYRYTLDREPDSGVEGFYYLDLSQVIPKARYFGTGENIWQGTVVVQLGFARRGGDKGGDTGSGTRRKVVDYASTDCMKVADVCDNPANYDSDNSGIRWVRFEDISRLFDGKNFEVWAVRFSVEWRSDVITS